MTVAELIQRLSKLNPDLQVAAGYPIVSQGDTREYQDSLINITDVQELHLRWDTWMGRDFVFLEGYPEVSLADGHS